MLLWKVSKTAFGARLYKSRINWSKKKHLGNIEHRKDHQLQKKKTKTIFNLAQMC